MRIWIGLAVILQMGLLQAQNIYRITYQKSYNDKVIENQDPVVVFAQNNLVRITSEQILNYTKTLPYEETFVDEELPEAYKQIAFTSEGVFGFVDSLSIGKQIFTLTDEQKTILGYTCKKARIVINSNTIDLWYTKQTGIHAAPTVLGLNLGMVLEVNRNGNFVTRAQEVKKVNLKGSKNPFQFPYEVKMMDQLTYRDLIWKSRFITLKVFDDEVINFSDQSQSDASVLRFANGTVILKKVKFPLINPTSQMFVELTEQSNGDAYDRTGSVFVIPTDGKISFLEALQNGIQSIPAYTNGNGKEYRGVVRTDGYTPLVELMRFFTPFGIKQYNGITLKDKVWHDKVSYRQDISELSPIFGDKEMYVGVFIGNYDKGGHKVSLEITIHQEQQQATKKTVIPLFNTTNVMEMAGQEYATMFDNDKGLMVAFTLDQDLKNVRLRYIVTGHGGWENGDEFVPKKNMILIDNQLIHAFTPWRQDCGSYRLYNPASGNFENGLSSSDYSRSNWCPGTLTNPEYIDLGTLKKGTHYLQIKIPQGKSEGNSFSSWNVSGVLIGEL